MTLKTGETKQQLSKATKSLGEVKEEKESLEAELKSVREQLGAMTERFNELAAVNAEHDDSDESNKTAAAVKRERVRLTVVHKFELEGLEGS